MQFPSLTRRVEVQKSHPRSDPPARKKARRNVTTCVFTTRRAFLDIHPREGFRALSFEVNEDRWPGG